MKSKQIEYSDINVGDLVKIRFCEKHGQEIPAIYCAINRIKLESNYIYFVVSKKIKNGNSSLIAIYNSQIVNVILAKSDKIYKQI